MTPRETVFLVDDDPAVLKSLSRLLDSAGFQPRPFGSPDAFLEAFDPAAAGCVVLDLSMPGRDGLELQEALARRGSELPVIFLTGRGDVPQSVRAMKRGAVDFLSKPVDDEVLLAAIREALGRDRERREGREERAAILERLETLTERERQVLDGVAEGRLNKQIGGTLGIAEKTVKVHRGRAMEKMKAGSVAELVRMLERAGVRR
ncbi:MAG TPA: response regulator [Thermoanaerobaculia bacterium]|nr:response regulator [Thermoanaerobaculia bacterium]